MAAKGYILPLPQIRWMSMDGSDEFVEPVDEFTHSRNKPLVCFIIDQSLGYDPHLTHIALGRRGQRAGTDLRQLKLSKIYSLGNAINVRDILDGATRWFKSSLRTKFGGDGGLTSEACLGELIRIVSSLAPDVADRLGAYSQERLNRISALGEEAIHALAEQREAVATAMNIAGIDRDALRNWDIPAEGQEMSFLSGLRQVRMREDQMLVNDLTNLPGYDAIEHTSHNAVVFNGEKSRLTVVLANRLPLEEQLGVDLIYYNEVFKCFLMIQYKAMEGEEERNAVFRFPNDQLTDEIARMDAIMSELEGVPAGDHADGFRLSENPFFLKICPRYSFNPDSVSLVKGMYLPLDYWKRISKHPSMAGPQGGLRISYRNVRRYFDNTDFVKIAANGWVGTNIEQSEHLSDLIRRVVESGRTVVFAVNRPTDLKNREGDQE